MESVINFLAEYRMARFGLALVCAFIVYISMKAADHFEKTGYEFRGALFSVHHSNDDEIAFFAFLGVSVGCIGLASLITVFFNLK